MTTFIVMSNGSIGRTVALTHFWFVFVLHTFLVPAGSARKSRPYTSGSTVHLIVITDTLDIKRARAHTLREVVDSESDEYDIGYV